MIVDRVANADREWRFPAPGRGGRWPWILVATICLSGPSPLADEAAVSLLQASCGDCHSGGAAEGGFDLDGLLAPNPDSLPERGHDGARRRDWVKVVKNIRSETMPPAGHAPRPTPHERRTMLDWIERTALQLDPGRPDPGETVPRRLNRIEYVNTVRDLTGISLDIIETLPADDTGHGFDTIGEVLVMSPMLVERYLNVAEEVAERILADIARHRAQAGVATPYPHHLLRLFGAPGASGDSVSDSRRLGDTVERLGRRGFRRQPEAATRSRLLSLATSAMAAPGGSFESGVAAAITAILASPGFLFRDERPTADPPSAGSLPVDEFTLATRLSYFLWSTMPDDELLALAAEGRLRSELPGQLDRMIRDERANALGSNFVGQWLQTRDVEALPFNLTSILGMEQHLGEKIFSEEIRRAMRLETEMLFMHLLRENRPVTDLLVGRSTFLNGPLAAFYGIDGVQGKHMRLVELPAGSHRGGLLTHGSMLVVTSNPSRTSPVKRGLFVLENLLGMPPPPAPPDVPQLDVKTASGETVGATMRQLMEKHRAEAMCASCHARMDPLGLALEGYDPLGRWRGEGAEGLDTSGRLMTGESFRGPHELAERIADERRKDFQRCLVEKLLTYALGRGIEYFDAPAVDAILERSQPDGGLRAFVVGVVDSVPFQRMRADSHPPSE